MTSVQIASCTASIAARLGIQRSPWLTRASVPTQKLDPRVRGDERILGRAGPQQRHNSSAASCNRLHCSCSNKECLMDLGLKGKNAVILGGTRGIGRAIAD